MALVSKGYNDSKIVTFDNAYSILNSKSLEPPTHAKPLEFLNSHIVLAKIPYTGTTSAKKAPISGKYREYANFITDKLMLNSEQSIKLVEMFAERIDMESNTYSQNLAFFLSMILQQQSMFFQISLKVLNSKVTEYQTLKSNLIKDGYKIIDTLIENIEFISNLQRNLDVNQYSIEIDPVISNNLDALLIEILNYLIYIMLKSERGFQTTSVEKWFKLMEFSKFLSSSSLSYASVQTKATIESLSTLISLLFLDLEYNVGALDDESTFINDPKSLINVTNHLLHTSSNSIILYACSIILHRQHTFLQANQSHPNYKQYVEQLQSSVLKNIEVVYLSFVEEAAKLNVCESLIKCCGLISYDPIFPNILGSFVISFVPYIESDFEIIKTISIILKKSSNKIIQKFFDNPFTDELMILLKAKMPQTLNSFLEIISVNSNLAVEELRLVPSFTTKLDSDVFNSSYEIDDQQPELFRLTKDIVVSLPFELNNELTLLMKAGTKGQLLSSNRNSSLVLFIHEYNGWSLLGRILKNLSIKISLSDASRDETRLIILEKLNEIITNLDKEVIDLVFNAMNAFIGESDILDIFFRIFDQALFFKNIELSTACLNLLNTLCVKGYPSRVWSHIFKSDMFTLKANGNLAFEILEKVEIISGNYDFSISLLNLSNTLLNTSLVFSERKNQKLKSQVIDSCTNYSIKVFENFHSWKFNSEHQKYELGGLVIDYLDGIVKFKIHSKEVQESSINDTFKTSYTKIINHLLVSGTEDLRSIRPFISIFENLSNFKMVFTHLSNNGVLYHKLTKKSIEFVIHLLKFKSVVNSKLFSNLEKELYLDLPSVIKAYVSNEEYRSEILDLLTQLVSFNFEENPLSMLSHLNTSNAAVLVNSLHENVANSDIPTVLKSSTLKFVSSVMKNNQKGLSLFFITGKNTLTGTTNTKDSISDKSIFKLLKRVVLKITDYASPYEYHLLNALALCIRVWHNVASDDEDVKFIDKILEIMTKNKQSTFWEIEVLSKSVEIISLYLFVSAGRNKNCESKIIEFLNKDTFILSLHAKFQISERSKSQVVKIQSSISEISESEFELKQFIMSNCKLDEVPYDFYSFEFLFGRVKSWSSLKNLLVKDGEEIKCIQAEIGLAKSYGGLITCYCNVTGTSINTDYCLFVSSLLKENYKCATLNFYEDIYKGRIELSFLIILTISKSKANVKDTTMFSLITSTVKLLESKEVSLFEGLTTLNVGYYKPLLRILILSLSMINTEDFVAAYSSTLREVFKNIICKSIVVLFNSVRSQALSVATNEFGDSPLINKQIDDVLISLSMVKDFLKLKSDETLDSAMANILITSGAYRSIAHMFTSSHLIKINGEEIFMNYSMSFIYEFVQRKAISEKLINDGVFHLLTESPLALIIQKGHVTPYSSNQIIVRIHRLWVKRILPILLTLSVQFSDSIIFELCKFALAFTNQFQYNIQAWLETDSYISQSIIEETEQLILFAKLLNRLDAYNYVSAELGKSIEEVKLVPGLDQLAERMEFVNALNYLLTHPKYLAMKVRTTDGDITIVELTEELKSLKDSLLA